MKVALAVFFTILVKGSFAGSLYANGYRAPIPPDFYTNNEENSQDNNYLERLFNSHVPKLNADSDEVNTVPGSETPYPSSPAGIPIVPPEYFPEYSDIPIEYVSDLKILDPIEAVLMVVNVRETRAVLGLMKPLTGQKSLLEITTNGVTFTIGMFGLYQTAIIKSSPGTQGPNSAAEKLERALRVVEPGFVISVGVCFGKDKTKFKYGDILVASIINDYEYMLLGEEKDVPRSPQPAVGARLLDIFDEPAGFKLLRAPDDPVQIKVCPLISGPNLVDNVEVKNKLFNYFPDAQGGEMEGGGILSAVQAVPGNKPEAIIIKAISDWADGSKGYEWQPFAAHAAASYVLYHMQTSQFKELVPSKY